MADTTTKVSTKRFVVDEDLAANIQTWYRSLDVDVLKAVEVVPEGIRVRVIVVYVEAV